MKAGLLFMSYLVLFVSMALGQGDRAKQTEEVRVAVDKAVADDQLKVKGVLYDLRLFDGKIIITDDEGFHIAPEKGKSAVKLMKIKYVDVIEFETKNAALSFFPDPDQKPFAEWTDVKKISHGDSLDIDMLDGEHLFGVLLRTSESDISIMQGNETLVLKRDNVARILLARRDTPAAKKILKGAGKGAGTAAGAGVGKSSHPHPAGSLVDAAILAGATAAGAVNAAVKRWPNDRLLIYSR